MEQLLQASINGVMLGAFYAAMVLGFSLIWGVMGVINLAHGEFVMWGAYGAWVLAQAFGWEPLTSLVVIVPVAFVVGYVIQRTIINPLIEQPHLMTLVVTFGLAFILSNIANQVFSATPRRVQSVFSGSWAVGAVTVPPARTLILVAALVLMVALYLFLQRTRLGKSIRAAAQNKRAARIVGIDIPRVYAMTFGIGIALTAAAGALASPILPIFPFMGPPFTLRAFAITALAGLGSIPGALAGGLILGLIETFIATYVPGIGTNLGIIAAFVLLVVVLVARPQGLFGGLRPAEDAA